MFSSKNVYNIYIHTRQGTCDKNPPRTRTLVSKKASRCLQLAGKNEESCTSQTFSESPPAFEQGGRAVNETKDLFVYRSANVRARVRQCISMRVHE